MIGLKMIQETIETIRKIWEHIRVAQSRQKSYTDKRKRHMEFQASDKVFLKVLPTIGIKGLEYEAN